MVRGTVVGMTLFYAYLKPTMDIIYAGAVVGLVCFFLGIYATLTVPETHDKDLDFND
jgi:putative effector of murein hydrolase LrgA (UPF0299 family)